MANIIMTSCLFYECPKCEAELELGQTYCSECGESMNWIEKNDLTCECCQREDAPCEYCSRDPENDPDDPDLQDYYYNEY